MPNATIAVGTAISIGNAHLHHRQDSEEEVVAAVDGITEDDVDDVEEDVVEDTKVLKVIQRMLLSSRRDQTGQHLSCNRCRFHPQCPVLLRQEQDRETS